MNGVAVRSSIVLIGPMAVGKSTIGAQLARLMNRTFVDSDQVFEEKHGSIPAAFSSRGEGWFRQVEARIIANILAGPGGMVLSLGGGAVLDTGTQQLLRDATVIFLETDVDAVRERILRSGHRPLLQSPDNDPVRRWSQVFAGRECVYRRLADFSLDVRQGSPEELAVRLLGLLDPEANQPEHNEPEHNEEAP